MLLSVSGLKSLLLERRLEAINEQLEMKEAQLAEVLTAANLEPTTLQSINSRLQEVLENKNQIVKALQYDVAKVSIRSGIYG
jgi:hypothetical protein